MDDYVNQNPEMEQSNGEVPPRKDAAEAAAAKAPAQAAVWPPVPANKEAVPPKAGKPEFLFAAAMVLIGILTCNFVLFGGLHLGFALGEIALIFCAAGYLRATGHRFDWYSGSLLGISLVIAAGFARSDDDFVKAVMFLFLLVAVNLSLCLAAKQNRRDPGSAASLLDAPRALFTLGFGGMGSSGKGLVRGVQNSGTAGRKTGAVILGLVISVPVLVVMVPLLMDADAAFEGLLKLLPEFDLAEYLLSAFCGLFLGWVLYSRGVAMNRKERPDRAVSARKGWNSLTVSTILAVVCLLYTVYLFSQLAYFAGGFSGILPEEFTLAEYARRGFFEMAWLCAINLLLICGSVSLIRREIPKFMRLCCLFIGFVTIFLVAAASAKMFMYIGSFGLTRRRVLTEVIMLWLALTTVIVGLWLFKPRLPYMKLVMLTAMVMGAAVLWADVDTLVASYNVSAYRSGRLETVDMDHMESLGHGATVYIHQLTGESDPVVSRRAREILRFDDCEIEDFRQWNLARAKAADILEEFHGNEEQAAYTQLQELLGFEVPRGELVRRRGFFQPEITNGQQFFRIQYSPEDGAELKAMLQDLGWNSGAVHVNLQRVVFGQVKFDPWFTDLADGVNPPVRGFWMFRDLNPEAEDPSDPYWLLLQKDPRFYLVCCDSDRDALCFYLFDATV